MSSPSQVPLVARVNGWVAGCLIVFMVPFFLIGAVVAATAFSREAHDAQFYTQLGAGGIFMMFAVLMTVVVTLAMKRNAEITKLRAANPAAPWLWREDWAQSIVREQGGAQRIGLLVFALVWTLISSGVVVAVLPRLKQGNYAASLGLIFPAIGLALLSVAIYRWMRHSKFGASELRLASLPIQPGRTFHVSLKARLTDLPPDGIAANLSLIHRVVSGSGDSRTVRETVEWDEKKMLPAGSAQPSVEGMIVPISFTIPQDAQPCDERFSSNAYYWRLRVEAEVPGIDYAAEFELPVFRTELEKAPDNPSGDVVPA